MKRLIKRFLVSLSSLFSGNDELKVIYYHDIGTTYTEMGTPENLFKRHVEIAQKRGYKFVPVSEVSTGKKKGLVIAFDDGFRGIWNHRDYFREQHLVPLVFIAVDLVGKDGYLTWPEILELQNEYGFQFESHTWTHRSLTEVLSTELRKELEESRGELSRRLGRDVLRLCFPRGLFSESIVSACVDAGYVELYTSIPTNENALKMLIGWRSVNVRLLPRILVQNASCGEFLCLIRGGLSFFSRRYLRRHFLAMHKRG